MTPNIHNCVNALKNEKRIKVVGYEGYWSVIDDHKGYVLLEHNTFGDETCYLVFKAKDFFWQERTLRNGETITVPCIPLSTTIFETYDDITTCLEDEGII